MSLLVRRRLGTLLACISIVVAAGDGAIAQDPPAVLPPAVAEPGVVLGLAPSPNGDAIGPAPQIDSFAATISPDGVMVYSAPSFYVQPWGGDDPSSLLEMGNVQKELELIDEQKERLREAQRKMHEGRQKHFAEQRELHTRRIRDRQDYEAAAGRSAGGNTDGQNSRVQRLTEAQIAAQKEEFKRSQERLKELRDQLAKEVEDVLLPHQKKRLDEIALRMKMRQRGTTGSLVDTELAKSLDITDAQKDRIRRKAEEVQKDLEEKIAKLREEARQEILEELSPEQKTRLKELLGAEFDERPQPAPTPRIRRSRSATVEKNQGDAEPKTEEKPAREPAENGS
jgi:hypothetical protein